MAYKKGKIKKKNVDLDEIDFAVDTALSWDGEFPHIGKGDYVVTLNAEDRGSTPVIVSRRYTSARDHKDAASIAKDAFAERHGFKKRDVRVESVRAVI